MTLSHNEQCAEIDRLWVEKTQSGPRILMKTCKGDETHLNLTSYQACHLLRELTGTAQVPLPYNVLVSPCLISFVAGAVVTALIASF